MLPVLAEKDPDALLAYQLDVSDYLAALGDTLDSAQVFVADANRAPIVSDLVVAATQATGAGVITFWLSGGTPGQRYRVRTRFKGANLTPVQLDDFRTVIVPITEK